MSFTKFITGASGAMGLLSGVKGMFDSADAARKQKRLQGNAKAEEMAWYKRNYYGDYLNNSVARAAMKRVERTLHNQNKQNRAYAAISGATPELALARNRQALESMENVVSNLAAQDDANKSRIDSMHRQNLNALRNQELGQLSIDEQNAANSAVSGFNLLNNALLGATWGKER